MLHGLHTMDLAAASHDKQDYIQLLTKEGGYASSILHGAGIWKPEVPENAYISMV